MKIKSTYNCIIIDDERFARELIADYLKSFSEFTVIGKYKSTLLTRDVLKSGTPIDVIFLDIQMPNETGIEFLKKNTIKPKVIFTTAYPEYALDGYNFEVVDYLLKPIPEKRFNKAIQKLIRILDTEDKAKAFEYTELVRNQFIKLKSGTLEHKIFFNELIRIQADGEYARYIATKKTFFVLASLKKIITQLPDSFIQVHRSHIVAMSEIKGREKYTLILNDLTQIPIGKTYRTKVLKQLKF